MNELNLTEILQTGQTVYSPIFGYGEVITVSHDTDKYPILVRFQNGSRECFTKYGKYFYHDDDKDTECVLFPSKEKRDWSKYMPIERRYDFEPFEMVLCRNNLDEQWIADLFSHYPNDVDNMVATIGGRHYFYCIPFAGNERLLGTDKSE